MDKFKRLNDAWDTTTFDYDAETDTLTKMRGEGKLVVKGGNVVVGMDKFYILNSENKVDKSHALNDMEAKGDIELDLTGDEYKMSLSSYEDEKKVSSVELKNGMRFNSLEDSEKESQVVFDENGGVKSIEDLDMQVPFFGDIKARNGKMRYVSDVSDLLDDGGKIDSEKMEEFLLEGGSENEYSGYFVYDKEGGEDGKPFVAVVADGAGIGEFGMLTSEALQEKKLDTIRDLFGVDLKEQKTGSAFASLDVEALEEVKKKINSFRGAIAGKTEEVKVEEKKKNGWSLGSFVKDIGESVVRGVKSNVARSMVQEGLKEVFGEDYKMSDVDYALFSSPEFLDSTEAAVDHFIGRLDNPDYLKKYGEGFDFGDFGNAEFATESREDLNVLMDVIGKVDSFYDSRIPKMMVSLASGSEIGTLVVGGNVEVYDGDLKITENLKGVSFGAGVVAGDDSFKVDSSIDRIYTTNNDNVWEIKENSQGGLEPFLVGGDEPVVEITNLDIKTKLTREDRNMWAWAHDFFWEFKDQEILGREVVPAIVSMKVSEDAKKIMDGSRSPVEFFSVKGPYEVSVEFQAVIDKTGKSQAAAVTKEAGPKIADTIYEAREQIRKFRGILDMDSSADSFVRERKIKSFLSKDESSEQGAQSSFLRDTMVGLVMEMPSSEVVQAGTNFISQGYSSYGDIANTNMRKVSDVLNFLDTSLGYIEKDYRSGGLDQNAVISLIRKENGDLFLRNSRGEIFSVDTEIEQFVGRLIPILVSERIQKTQNRVLSEKKYKFERDLEVFITKENEKEDE